MVNTPITDALSMDNASRLILLAHARRMESDRARLIECLREIVEKDTPVEFADARAILADLDASGEGK